MKIWDENHSHDLRKDVIQLKKTQTKAFANLVASVILLVFEIWAYTQTLGFKIV